jgi:hypothetical protein
MAAGDITAKRTNYSDFPCNVFDGVDDYVEIPHNAAQLGANLSNGFTISAWINARGYGELGAGVILSKSTDAGSTNGFRLCMNSASSTYRVSMQGGTSRYAANNAALPLGTWQHILITISSGSLLNFYLNGSLSGNANQDLAIGTIAGITTTNAMRIGNHTSGTTTTFDGSIRSVKMWNRVLSTTEIANDSAGLPNELGLIHNFKLGGDYADYGSVGVTATNSGSVANTTLPLKLQTNASQLNLAAVTDKIICVPRPGRIGEFALIGANRAAA